MVEPGALLHLLALSSGQTEIIKIEAVMADARSLQAFDDHLNLKWLSPNEWGCESPNACKAPCVGFACR